MNKNFESIFLMKVCSSNVFPSFLMFTNFCENLKLDGYIIRLDGEKYGQDLEVFAKAFCEVIVRLAELDPAQRNCMDREVERSNWVLEKCL